MWIPKMTLQWRHDGCDYVSNHQTHDRLLNRLFRRRSKKTSKLRVTGLCAGNSPGTGEFPAQMASNAENVSIWWRHHDKSALLQRTGNKSQPMLTQNYANELDESHLDDTKTRLSITWKLPTTHFVSTNSSSYSQIWLTLENVSDDKNS